MHRHLRRLIRSTAVVLAVAILGDWSFIFMQVAWDWLSAQLIPYRIKWLASHIVLIGWIGILVAVGLGVDAGFRRRERPQVERVPYCRHCGYITIGLSEPVCPECGSKVDDA